MRAAMVVFLISGCVSGNDGFTAPGGSWRVSGLECDGENLLIVGLAQGITFTDQHAYNGWAEVDGCRGDLSGIQFDDEGAISYATTGVESCNPNPCSGTFEFHSGGQTSGPIAFQCPGESVVGLTMTFEGGGGDLRLVEDDGSSTCIYSYARQ